MLRDVDLRFLEDALKMTDAQGGLGKEMQNAQPRLVTKALVNLHQLHALNMPVREYRARGKRDDSAEGRATGPIGAAGSLAAILKERWAWLAAAPRHYRSICPRTSPAPF